MPKIVINPKVAKLTASVNETLMDRGIRHSVFLEGLKTGEANKVIHFMNTKIQPDLIKQIETGVNKTKRTLTNLKKLVKSNDGLIRAGYREIGKNLKKRLTGIAVTEARFQQALLKRVVPINFEFSVPSIQVLRNLVTQKPIRGALLNDWLQNASRRDINRVNNALRIGIAEGESTANIIRRIRGSAANNFTDGVMQINRREATSLVRTSVNNVVTEAREQTYLANDDIIKEVQYVATLDARTTEICASLDGRTFPINEGPRPPQHFNCRSTTVPITKSWKELGIDLKEAPVGTRASMNGQVSAKQTYGPWLKKQPKFVQEQVLGVEKAALFRRGNITIRQFTNASNKPLTISQLRRIENRSLKQATQEPKTEFASASKQPKLNTPEYFQRKLDNPELQPRWMKRVLERHNSGNPFTESWAKYPGRKEFWNYLVSKQKPLPKIAPLPEVPIPKVKIPKRGGSELKGTTKATWEMTGEELAEHLTDIQGELTAIEAEIKAGRAELKKKLFGDANFNPNGAMKTKKPWITEAEVAERKATYAARSQYWIEDAKLKRSYDAAKAALRDRAKEALKLPNAERSSWLIELDKFTSKEMRKKVGKAKEFLESTVSKKVGPISEVGANLRSGRAGYHRQNKSYYISGSKGVDTHVHEMIHHLEYEAKGMHEQAARWRNLRTKDYKLEKLNKVTNISYEDWEVTRVNEFFDAYVGKIYQSGWSETASSEVLTMGMQEIYTSPLRFLNKDRDHFEMVINLMRGHKIPDAKLMGSVDFNKSKALAKKVGGKKYASGTRG